MVPIPPHSVSMSDSGSGRVYPMDASEAKQKKTKNYNYKTITGLSNKAKKDVKENE